MQKEKGSWLRGEITPATSQNIEKIKIRAPRGIAAKRESAQEEDPHILVPQAHHPNLQVVTMKRGSQRGQNLGLREKKKESIGLEARTQVVMAKRLMVLCRFLGSLAA